MTHVYILTETGKGFNDAGIETVLEKLSENHVDVNNVTIDSGLDLNQPNHFTEILKAQTSPWVVLSTNDEIIYAPPVMKDEFIRLLSQADKKDNSWQILTTAIANHKKA